MNFLNNIYLSMENKPVRFTFLASILLSLISILGVVTIGKDGALYVTAAQSVSNEGLAVAFSQFDWPWYSILIALTHNLTSIDHQTVAYIYTVLFMAGTCALLVSLVHSKSPSSVWWAVLLVLSVPVFNSFRADIIRETGFWFFIVLTVWLVARDNYIGFLKGLGIQACIVFSAMFRLEALFIGPAIFLFLILNNDIEVFKEKFSNVFKTFSMFFILFFIVVLAFFSTELLSQKRIGYYLSLINPYAIYQSFLSVSDQFAQVALVKWSHSDATVIVFFGFLAALIVRIFSYAGIAGLVFLSSSGRRGLLEGVSRYKLNFIAIALYFCVLLIFFFQLKYINSRYSSMLLILSVPILAVAVSSFFKNKVFLKKVFIVFSLLFMVANVVSTSTKKTHYLEMAQWVSENVSADSHVYYEDSRISYYAGRGYPYPVLHTRNSVFKNPSIVNSYDYLIIESNGNEKILFDWADENNLEVVAETTNGKRTLFALVKK